MNEQNKNQMLTGILNFIEHIRQWPNNVYHFRIAFWDEEHFIDKQLDKMQFGFNVHNETFYKSIEIKKKFLKQGLALQTQK